MLCFEASRKRPFDAFLAHKMPETHLNFKGLPKPTKASLVPMHIRIRFLALAQNSRM
jgi:hypothetical protein